VSAAPLAISNDLDARLRAPLARLRRRARLYLALEGLVQVALALLGAGLAQLLLDRWLRFSVDQRAFVNSIITVVWLWVIYRDLIARLLAPLPDDALATVVDRAHPELYDQITTAVQFASGQVGDQQSNSPRLVRATLEDACRAVERVDFLAVLNHRRARQRAIHLGAAIAVMLGAFAIFPELMGTWFRRNWLLADIAWPQRIYITPEGYESGVRRVPLGDELLISAIVHSRGEPLTAAELIWRTPSGRGGRENMKLRGTRRVEASVGVATEDVYFRIVGGDEETREYVAQAVERPQIVRSQVRVTPPAYTRAEPVLLEQQTVLEILKGSTVEMIAWTNKPLTKAEFVGAAGALGECELAAPDQIRFRLAAGEPATVSAAASQSATASSEPGRPMLAESGAYRFEIVDADGWNDRRPIRFTFKIVPDRPPGVELKAAGVGEFVTPQAELALELNIADAYGLASAALILQKGEEQPLPLALDGFVAGQREYRATPALPLDPFALAPGLRVRIWAEAADDDPYGPNVGRAPGLELRVLTAEEFLAEMGRRELELRREFERLLGEQRVMKDAVDRLLPALPASGPPATAAAQQLASLGRRQIALAGRCTSIRRQFEQILAEMVTSKVARTGDERRITDRIAAPLGALAQESIPLAAEQLAALRSGTSQPREAVAATQAEILRQMKSILANMLEWEGYREAVALLQEIIAQQKDVRQATLKAMERQLEAILDLDEPSDSAPSPRPKP
jgi:hypothetical protein